MADATSVVPSPGSGPGATDGQRIFVPAVPSSPGGDSSTTPAPASLSNQGELIAQLSLGGGPVPTVRVRLKPLDPYDTKELMTKRKTKDGTKSSDTHRLHQVSAYGKPWKTVARESLGVFDLKDKKRLFIFAIVESVIFDRAVLFVIMLNSVFIAAHDYWDLDAPQNKVEERLDVIFLILFALECLLKILAVGMLGTNGYLRDTWNWLDFIVVVTGIIDWAAQNLIGLELNFLRVFRVMRPLRSLTVLHEMKVIMNTVLLSIPRLGNVALMGLFLMTIFGVLGISFFSGVAARMCRETENPILGLDPITGAECWSFRRDMASETRLCGGLYQCPGGPEFCKSWSLDDPEDIFRPVFPIPDKAYPVIPWCQDSDHLQPPTSLAIPDFNYGITTFDNLPTALIVIFQCMTMEGWTDVMYMYQDSFSDIFSSVYFVLLIIIGGFFLLNIALAVVWDAFSSLSEELREAEEQEAIAQGLQPKPRKTPKEVGEEGDEEDRPTVAYVPYSNATIVTTVYNIAESDVFQNTVMFFIISNVCVMMTDMYPPPPPPLQEIQSTTNLVFTVAFAVELVVCHIAYGPKKYWTTMSTVFDGVIVISSFVELGVKGGGAVKALRGFRLLRIFKLAKKWTSFRILVKSMIRTVKSMGYFSVLLFLIMFVFTLMGSALFANKMRFNEDGSRIQNIPPNELFCPPYGQPGQPNMDCIPRAHFDHILWGFVTCFQILSGENWNTVMYDGINAMGSTAGAVTFFVLVVVVGQLIILNLFLCLLMSNFEESSSSIRAAEARRAALLRDRPQ
jgi:hypothetical protein